MCVWGWVCGWVCIGVCEGWMGERSEEVIRREHINKCACLLDQNSQDEATYLRGGCGEVCGWLVGVGGMDMSRKSVERK